MGTAGLAARITYYRAKVYWPTSPGVIAQDAKDFPTREEADFWFGLQLDRRPHALGGVSEEKRTVDLG